MNCFFRIAYVNNGLLFLMRCDMQENPSHFFGTWIVEETQFSFHRWGGFVGCLFVVLIGAQLYVL